MGMLTLDLRSARCDMYWSAGVFHFSVLWPMYCSRGSEIGKSNLEEQCQS